jgi:Lar family restriction alleviation protein
MKNFKCAKCGSEDTFTEKLGNNTGLYCSDCGIWIKWLDKNELRLVQRQTETQLKSCPFCGKAKTTIRRLDINGDYIVSCDNCCIRTDGYMKIEYAIKAWNKRYNEV